jgi:phage FluMu protein Com
MEEKAIIINYKMTACIEWKCPKCGHISIITVGINPYRIPAEDMPDEMCGNCEEFISLNF